MLSDLIVPGIFIFSGLCLQGFTYWKDKYYSLNSIGVFLSTIGAVILLWNSIQRNL